ncbi:class I SAM-dependent methyltransferase [Paraburkholderia nodosa]|uniref:class I SAM-dependent methyltransferase n=1 Tax=Paraburkholderia nodosa TaxID=392320 RepID=UPI0009F55E81|nr:methyltransferase domain-containing protein [Paraburkholderia nodosa]
MDSFYRAFEDRYRGSRELIKSRLAKYVPFFQPLASLYPGAKTFDLGCGRGEWLELMSEAGFAPTGADLDADMLEACRERNLPAIQGDAIEHLASLESGSCALISAFHVVEHVSFEQLRRIVGEALRVLLPGGLLILETPNPENLAVATSNFFLDPSHQKPIPALLLSFVAEHAGFDRVKVVRLQESPELRNAAAQIHLLDVVGGASPDYAIVAQKDAGSTQGAFDDAFAADYGLTLAALADRYDAKLESSIARIFPMGDRLQSVEGRLGIAEGRLQLAEGRLQLAEERFQFADEQRARSERLLQDMESRALRAEDLARQASTQVVEEQLHHAEDRYQLLEAQLERTEAMLRDAEARVQQANAHLQAVYRSTSWHVTAPMRWVSLGLRGKALAPARQAVKSTLQSGARYASSRPWLRQLAVTVLNRMPRAKARLVPIVAASMFTQPVDTNIGSIRVEDLDEHANRIHATLIAEFDRSQREKN